MCDTISAVGAATCDGAVLFGKNSDREHDEAQYLQFIAAAQPAPDERVRLTYKEIDQARKTHAVLLSKPHWIWGAEIGANEHGVVIGNEAVRSKIPSPMTEGIIGMDYLRLGLERARTVDEAIHVITTLLRAHGQGGKCGFRHEIAYHNSFILADPNGAKVLETVDREWVVTTITDYYAISNSMTLGETFEASSTTLKARAMEAGLYSPGSPFAFKSVYEDASQTLGAEYRRNRAMTLLGERSGRLRSTDFFRILRDHQEGPQSFARASRPRICAHGRDNPLGQTTASWVASLKPGRCIHWVTGTSAPCTGLFKPVLFDVGLPHHGTLPGAEADTTSLWWRHQQLRSFLDESTDATRNAFTEERDALEASFLRRIDGSDHAHHHEARQIVEACWRDALEFENEWIERSLLHH